MKKIILSLLFILVCGIIYSAEEQQLKIIYRGTTQGSYYNSYKEVKGYIANIHFDYINQTGKYSKYEVKYKIYFKDNDYVIFTSRLDIYRDNSSYFIVFDIEDKEITKVEILQIKKAKKYY